MRLPHLKVQHRQAFARLSPRVDRTGIWAATIGAIAVVLAAFVLIVEGNQVAATFVLVAVAAIIAVVLRESAQDSSD